MKILCSLLGHKWGEWKVVVASLLARHCWDERYCDRCRVRQSKRV
jgi:hypothetical protein